MKRLVNLITAVVNYLWWSWRFYSFTFRSRLARPDMLRNSKAISIGRRVEIRKHSRLEALGDCGGGKPKIVIGNGTSIHFYFHCGAAESVIIGPNVLIASRVYITDHDHDIENPDLSPRHSGKLITKPVVIEDGAWIGEGAVILKGVTVGKRAVVGANSVVTKDVPAYTVVGGVPAKVIRKLNFAKESD